MREQFQEFLITCPFKCWFRAYAWKPFFEQWSVEITVPSLEQFGLTVAKPLPTGEDWDLRIRTSYHGHGLPWPAMTSAMASRFLRMLPTLSRKILRERTARQEGTGGRWDPKATKPPKKGQPSPIIGVIWLCCFYPSIRWKAARGRECRNMTRGCQPENDGLLTQALVCARHVRRPKSPSADLMRRMHKDPTKRCCTTWWAGSLRGKASKRVDEMDWNGTLWWFVA